MSCNFVSPSLMNQQESTEECTKLSLFTHLEIPLPKIDWKQLTQESMIWIGENSPPDTTATDKVYCQAWSIRKLEYQSVPCETQLPVFCQGDLLGKSLNLFTTYIQTFNFSIQWKHQLHPKLI